MKAAAKRKGVSYEFRKERGKGSHGMLYFGDRRTTVKDRKAEISPGLLRAMLKQLGLSLEDLQ